MQMMLLIKSICRIYKENLEKVKGSDFIFDSVQLLYYKFHNCGGLGGSYIDSPDWIKKKKAPINKKNTDNVFSIRNNCYIKL